MPRVAGVDPGTVSFDVCVLQDGEPVLEEVFATGALSDDPAPLLQTLAAHGPYDLVYGPSGYGLPLVMAADVGERELAQMVLVRPDEAHAEAGVGGMRSLLRALTRSGLPVVFGPGVIHLPSVPRYRKYNRIDLGTADKVCAAAYAIVDQSVRWEITLPQTSMVLLELGGAFTAALAIDGGQIVDGMGGSSGPIGFRAAGALDGELAYLLGRELRKDALFTGGAVDPTGRLDTDDLDGLWRDPVLAEGWTALVESAAKAVRALVVSVPAPREIVVSGRLARLGGLLEALSSALSVVAPVSGLTATRASAAARGAALLADALAGGRHAGLAEVLGLRDCSGTALDYVRVAGSDTISLG
jgi:predicted butyrate kinase (DUF1464 family)